MKAVIRIPTIQFGYVEFEYEIKTGEEKQVIEAHNLLLNAYNGGEGLPKKDWDALLDGYLKDGAVDSDLYSKCNKEQQTILATIKRSLARINYGNRNSDKN